MIRLGPDGAGILPRRSIDRRVITARFPTGDTSQGVIKCADGPGYYSRTAPEQPPCASQLPQPIQFYLEPPSVASVHATSVDSFLSATHNTPFNLSNRLVNSVAVPARGNVLRYWIVNSTGKIAIWHIVMTNQIATISNP